MWQVGDEPVPGYRIESFLGQGSNATVWRASGPGRTAAALKFISLDGKLGLKEFRGIERVKEIRHAHLLPITAFWLLDDQGQPLDDHALESLHDMAHGRNAADGHPAKIADTLQPRPRWPRTLVVAMLLGEKNLLELLDEHREAGNSGIPVEDLLDYIEDAAKGIDFLNSACHDLGNGPVAVQHCDVKPQNILLVGNSAMVCDFGLARALGSADNYRTIAGPAGTPAYVAPECIQGAIPSCATDQYSLAITYFELRTGELPFAGNALTDIYEAHINGTLVLDRLPAVERRVISRATSLQPEERFPSSLEMVRELRRATRESVSTPEKQDTPSTTIGLQRDEQAHLHFASGNYQLAIADFTEAIRLNPHLVRANQGRTLRNRAVAYRNQGEYDKAIADYDEVIRLHPDCAKAYHGRATVYAARCDYDRAIEDYAQAIRAASGTSNADFSWDYASAYRQRGDACYERGEYNRALADYDEAIRIRPDWGAAHNQRGRAYLAIGNWQQAIADYGSSIELDAKFAYLYFCNRGSAHYISGDFDKAIEDFTAAIDKKPDYTRAYRYRSRAYAKIGMHDRANDDLATAKLFE